MKQNKLCLTLALLVGLSTQNVFAQDIAFNKKNGNFTTGDKTIAVLKKEKVKNLEINYLLQDASGSKTLLRYNVASWTDTFASETQFYYVILADSEGYKAYRPNFTGQMNTYKEVGEHILKNKLLNEDGTLNQQALKAYFEKNVAENPDYPKLKAHIDDSLLKLVNIPAQPVERDQRKEITANEFGKIGQGNVVIGYWEMRTLPREGFNASPDYQFLIKNINGGIIAVSRIAISGAHTYVFVNGIRSNENWTVPDLAHDNPVATKDGQAKYASQLAIQLVHKGLL